MRRRNCPASLPIAIPPSREIATLSRQRRPTPDGARRVITLQRSKSERGTRVAALFYTLIESAKYAGVEPAGYLAEATRRAIDSPGTVMLPGDLAST